MDLPIGWFDYIFWFVMITIGSVGAIWQGANFWIDRKKWDRGYILFKVSIGLYIVVIYALIWHPLFLNDPWDARQCVRGIVFLAGVSLVLDAFMRKLRRKLGC